MSGTTVNSSSKLAETITPQLPHTIYILAAPALLGTEADEGSAVAGNLYKVPQNISDENFTTWALGQFGEGSTLSNYVLGYRTHPLGRTHDIYAMPLPDNVSGVNAEYKVIVKALASNGSGNATDNLVVSGVYSNVLAVKDKYNYSFNITTGQTPVQVAGTLVSTINANTVEVFSCVSDDTIPTEPEITFTAKKAGRDLHGIQPLNIFALQAELEKVGLTLEVVGDNDTEKRGFSGGAFDADYSQITNPLNDEYVNISEKYNLVYITPTSGIETTQQIAEEFANVDNKFKKSVKYFSYKVYDNFTAIQNAVMTDGDLYNISTLRRGVVLPFYAGSDYTTSIRAVPQVISAFISVAVETIAKLTENQIITKNGETIIGGINSIQRSFSDTIISDEKGPYPSDVDVTGAEKDFLAKNAIPFFALNETATSVLASELWMNDTTVDLSVTRTLQTFQNATFLDSFNFFFQRDFVSKLPKLGFNFAVNGATGGRVLNTTEITTQFAIWLNSVNRINPNYIQGFKQFYNTAISTFDVQKVGGTMLIQFTANVFDQPHTFSSIVQQENSNYIN
jgi:hypothetical protein